VGEPVDGVEVLSPDPDADWDEEQPGLRFIRLVNVQAYADAILRLSPGVNALIGPNNRGKSAFIRALRAVFYGEARDSLVRVGTRMAAIEIGVERNRTLRFTRQPRRSPVNMWSLHEADGSVVEERGTRFESGGRAVPAWVETLCRITKVEDLDVQIAHQKFPVFLLGEAPSRRSAVLSIGQEAGYIRDMLALHRERCLRDNTFVKAGERELIEINAGLIRMQDLAAIRASLDGARTKAAAVQASSDRLETMQETEDRLKQARQRLRATESRRAAFAGLPDPARLSAMRDAIETLRECERMAERLLHATTSLANAKARLAALQALPGAVPNLESEADAEAVLRHLVNLRQAGEAAKARLRKANAGLAVVRADMAHLLEDMQGRCPTCGSSVDADDLLAHHTHFHSSVAA
jgi:DNA repair exonuclease SbcCD ATPase subunit